MSKRIVFYINEGDFNNGFPVYMAILENSKLIKGTHGRFPIQLEIERLYDDWKESYHRMAEIMALRGDFQFPDDEYEITQVSIAERKTRFQNISQKLSGLMESWLSQAPFETFLIDILDKTQENENIQVIFRGENMTLMSLPWHLWRLFEHRRNAEVSLCLSPNEKPSSNLVGSIKILGIVGSRIGINPEIDRKLLDRLREKGAKIRWLDKPELHLETTSGNLPHRNILGDHLWEKPWDLLFYAGHSYSTENASRGHIQINEHETISISELRNSFREAVQKGLKLAIFNSCDGLGMARILAQAGIPYSIVMREPIPDRIAQLFLKYFLDYFSQGVPLHLAVRKSRERIGDHDDFPCSSWHPTICQNLGAEEMFWDTSQLLYMRIRTGIIKLLKKLWSLWSKIPVGLQYVMVILIIAAALIVLFSSEDIVKYGYGSSLSTSSSIGDSILIENQNCEKRRSPNPASLSDVEVKLEQYREKCPLDPESLIYLNNIKALEEKQSQSSQALNTNFIEKSNQLVQDGDVIRIAAVVPIGSGIEKDNDTLGIAEELLRGIALAQDDINNEGGIKGRYLQIQITNESASSSRGSLSPYFSELLAEDPAIIAVVGHYTSNSVKNADKTYQKGKLTLISPTSTAVRVSLFKRWLNRLLNPVLSILQQKTDDFDVSDYVFRVAPTDEKASVDLVKRLVDKNLKKTAIAYEGTVYGQSMKQQIEGNLRRSGISSIEACNYREQENSGGSEEVAKRCLEKMSNDHVDSMIVIPATQITESTPVAYHLIVDSTAPQFSKVSRFSVDAAFGKKTLDTVGSNVVGMEVSIPWHISTGKECVNENFKDRLTAKFSPRSNSSLTEPDFLDSINWRTMMAYDATMALARGLSLLDSPDRSKLKDALLNVKADGFMGAKTVSFNDRGDRNITELTGDCQLGTIVEVIEENNKQTFGKPRD